MNSCQIHENTISLEQFESLQKAFCDFQIRAERLSAVYTAMQDDFKKVNLELDQKNAELKESLSKQEEVQTYLNSILESMDNGVIGINREGIITHFNRAASSITGFDFDSVVNRPFIDCFKNSSDKDPPILEV